MSDSLNDRSAFSGGDQTYLRDVQYGSGVKLDVRARLHREYSTAPQSFAQFEAGLLDWSPSARVLECGCGTGRFWDATDLPKSMSVTLSDLSPGMVAEAVERCRSAGFGDVVGRECDVQALPYEDESFDVVIANHMLYHVPDPDRAIAELRRVMAAGGMLVAATNGYGHMGAINDVIAEVLGDHKEGLYGVFGIDSGEARLRNQFRSVVWFAYDNDLIVDNPQAVTDYALSFPPGEFANDQEAAAVDAAVRRRFIDGVMRIRTRAGVFVASQPRD